MIILKCLIVDDEPLAREAIKGYCHEISYLEVIGVCKNVRQAQTFLQENYIDILFLDIQMPIITGIEWLKTQKDTPAIIMTTAYSEYALESYDFNVIDYLVKPISFERFKQSVEKVCNLMYEKTLESHLFIKQDKEIKKVKLSNILYIEAQQNYVKIVTIDETLITHSTLKGIKALLPEKDFIKIHKSFLVALHKIDKILDNKVFIREHILPLSIRLKKEVTTKVKSNKHH
ncbi:LytR/AlgR family response regulator transcription factor [Flavivirga eckloniae]|uniref:DNA-binding response regulator n=1 Tax=Flavivirga eckloniae TaxID=1803846 RepID=A0A2K9PUH8_9FLAO|nr:LytTR family DNA-binding domain-containing protein [Flavivirga eckloniae]AUP80197.1 DNA-binding response regulator [Flavivirga eckloniae]